MKRLIAVIFLTLCSLSVVAQTNEDKPETAKPMRDVTIVRNVSYIDIEGNVFYNAKVWIKSISADYLVHLHNRVKVKITNQKNKKVWKKTLYNSYLYIFSNGQVQIGNPNFDKIVIYKSPLGNGYTGIIREYEGVY